MAAAAAATDATAEGAAPEPDPKAAAPEPKPQREAEAAEEAPDVAEPEQSALSKLFDKLFGEAPTAVTRFLKSKGDKPITDLEVKRAPIQSAVNKALDIVALGQWSKAKKKVVYDQLFHLWLEFSLGGSRYLIEKNQVVKIGPAKGSGESASVASREGLTLNKLLGDAVKKYSPKRIYIYDPFSTNCQMFISHLLAAQGLYTASLKKFIYQPLDKLIKELPQYTGEVGKKVTDVAAYVDRLLQFFSRGLLALRRGGVVAVGGAAKNL